MNLPSDCLVRYSRLDDCLAGADLRAPQFGEEARQFDRIADVGRRRQWLAGRAVARELLREAYSFNQYDTLEIISRSDNGLGTRPLVVVNGCRIECGLSISHTARGVLVALAPKSERAIGVDLCDALESLTPGFVRLWFTSGEQRWIAGDLHRAQVLWAIKEAVFKAVSTGAPWNPREVEVHPAGDFDTTVAVTKSRATFKCEYRGQPVGPLSLAIYSVDGHAAAIACLTSNAEIRFSVPVPSSSAMDRKPTAEGSVAADSSDRRPGQTAVHVPSVENSPRWTSV